MWHCNGERKANEQSTRASAITMRVGFQSIAIALRYAGLTFSSFVYKLPTIDITTTFLTGVHCVVKFVCGFWSRKPSLKTVVSSSSRHRVNLARLHSNPTVVVILALWDCTAIVSLLFLACFLILDHLSSSYNPGSPSRTNPLSETSANVAVTHVLPKIDSLDYIFVANMYGSLFNHFDVSGLQSYRIRWNNAK